MLIKSSVIFLSFCLLTIHAIAEDDFSKYKKGLEMTCISDDFKVTNWSLKENILYMDGLPYKIDGETVIKKKDKNEFIIKSGIVELYVNFEEKRQVASTLGMQFTSECF